MIIEKVIVSDETSLKAHKELYRLPDDAYKRADDMITLSVSELSSEVSSLHISSTWRDMLRLALWKESPLMSDVYLLLKGLGIGPEELLPFSKSDVNDLFPWLYYGKRFGILRKICLLAKTNSEKHMKNREARVHCHLTSWEDAVIVASSL